MVQIKHRKLCIAWSVVWGVLALLLCVLWVRSYWAAYQIAVLEFGPKDYLLTGERGEFVLSYGKSYLYVPCWLVTIVPTVFATSHWLPYRFSLRTLLIATTLVAVGLGVVMWML